MGAWRADRGTSWWERRSPEHAAWILRNARNIQGFYGASSMERLPTEVALTAQTRADASTILDAPIETVWTTIRDFNGLPSWHTGVARSEIEDRLDSDVVGGVHRFWPQDGTVVRERLLHLDDRPTSFSYNVERPGFPGRNDEATTGMHRLDGVRRDKLSGTRDFLFGEGQLHEKLLHLDDAEMSFSCFITRSPLPWLDDVSGPRLRPVNDGNRCFGVRTGDRVASPQDDVTLIPMATNEVHVKAFDTVASLLAKKD